jgi:hypothetical protein
MSEKISDVPIGPCAWRGQNGHVACKDIKGSTKKIIWAESMIILSLSLSLSLLHKNIWLTWSSEEAPRANPRRAFLVLQAKTQTKGCPWCRHVTGPKIASTLWRRLWERRGRSYQNKNPERWLVIGNTLHQERESRWSRFRVYVWQIWTQVLRIRT